MKYKYYLVEPSTGETIEGSDNKEELLEKAMNSKEDIVVVNEDNWKRQFDLPDWLLDPCSDDIP